MQKHTITIGQGGAVSITVEGIKGSGCQQATADLEAKLGKVTRNTPTAEMYQRENVQNVNRH